VGPVAPVDPFGPVVPVGPVLPKIPVSPSKLTLQVFDVISPSINVIYMVILPLTELYISTFPSK
jgi:hypothetical protein